MLQYHSSVVQKGPELRRRPYGSLSTPKRTYIISSISKPVHPDRSLYSHLNICTVYVYIHTCMHSSYSYLFHGFIAS
jgi:hypothetical protein